MADQVEGQPPAAAAQTPSPPLLPTQQANFFTAATNPMEILIGIGLSRASIAPSPQGATLQGGVEWVACLSVSPVAAKHLQALLQATIDAYEKQFGKIPQDPAFKLATTNIST
jgi:hypothetical protein